MFEESKLEITAMGKTLSVDGKLSMRWRLHLWPKGVMSHALDFMAPILQGWGFPPQGGDPPVGGTSHS